MLSLRCRINANVPELLVIIGEAPRREPQLREEGETDDSPRYIPAPFPSHPFLSSFLASFSRTLSLSRLSFEREKESKVAASGLLPTRCV